jgi:hypothetical protein
MGGGEGREGEGHCSRRHSREPSCRVSQPSARQARRPALRRVSLSRPLPPSLSMTVALRGWMAKHAGGDIPYAPGPGGLPRSLPPADPTKVPGQGGCGAHRRLGSMHACKRTARRGRVRCAAPTSPPALPALRALPAPQANLFET